MFDKQSLKRVEQFISPYKVTDAKGFKLKDFKSGDTAGIASKEEAAELLATGVNLLSDLQDRLYAQDSTAVLLVFQAMDAAGKDGTIKHVMSGVNPQGCQVFSFKQPSTQELDHDYMWRYMKCVPERGRIGIFNRSYYEEVLVVRVHKELLKAQRIPEALKTNDIWKGRLEDIRNHERYLSRNGVVILKFFLNVSKAEQKKRFLARLDIPEKNWKFSPADVAERQHWSEYMAAYEEAISATATPDCPWYVVPADNKWFSRLVVAGAVVSALDRLDLKYPKVSKEKLQELSVARAMLLAEK